MESLYYRHDVIVCLNYSFEAIKHLVCSIIHKLATHSICLQIVSANKPITYKQTGNALG